MAQKLNIEVEQGTTFQLILAAYDEDGIPINFTGYTATMQAREDYSSADTIFSISSAAGDIVLGGALGTISITISDTVTTDLVPDEYVWDIKLRSPLGVVSRFFEGECLVTPQVTKED